MTENLWPDELKLLVVDDEQDVLNLIRLSLEPAGFRVLRTSRPEEGLDLALQEQPDLLLLDIMMPGFNGLELLRRVRKHPNLTDIPAIVISARAHTADQQRMLKLSERQGCWVDEYIGKPFNPADLLRTVKNVLLKHRDFLIAKNKAAADKRRRQRTSSSTSVIR